MTKREPASISVTLLSMSIRRLSPFRAGNVWVSLPAVVTTMSPCSVAGSFVANGILVFCGGLTFACGTGLAVLPHDAQPCIVSRQKPIIANDFGAVDKPIEGFRF